MEQFTKHKVSWTREKVNNFWDYYDVMNNGLRELSFARLHGDIVAKLASGYIDQEARNLDYGCGAGYLMDNLFKLGIDCEGLDFSEQSVVETRNKFKDEPHFKGAILSAGLPNQDIIDETYGAVFLLETIEHLLADEIEPTLKEINRIIKPGGFVLITTPNNEKLEKSETICPDCGCIFHRVQHVNTFTVSGLSELMDAAGFSKVRCEGLLLVSRRGIYNRLKHAANEIYYFFTKEQAYKPNLIYIGRKR